MEQERALQLAWKECTSLKSLQILSVLTQVKHSLGVTALAEITQLPTATVYRVLQDLVQCDFVIREPDSKAYRIGFASWNFASKVKDSNYLYNAVAGESVRLNMLTGETVHTVKLDNMMGMYTAKENTKNKIGLRSQLGDRIPLYCTSAGKVLMAWQDENWLKGYFAQVKMDKHTPQTLCTEQALRRELEVIRVQGYALDNRERHDDVMCVAAPVFEVGDQVVCSISIAAPYYRFSLDQAVACVPELLKSVSAISKKLGGELPFSID